MRRLYYFGDATDEKSGALYSAVENATEPMVITICSNGGEANGAAAVAHAIRNAKVHIHTYGIGDVSSAAVDILAAGHTRGIHPSTVCMTHASFGFTDDRNRKLAHAAERSLYQHIPNVLDNWSKLFGKRKQYWTAEQMRAWGFVHYVSPTPLANELHGENDIQLALDSVKASSQA